MYMSFRFYENPCGASNSTLWIGRGASTAHLSFCQLDSSLSIIFSSLFWREGKNEGFDFTAVFVPKDLSGKGIAPSFPQFPVRLMENNAVNSYMLGCLALQAFSHYE